MKLGRATRMIGRGADQTTLTACCTKFKQRGGVGWRFWRVDVGTAKLVARSSQMRIRAPPSAMRKVPWHFLKQRKLRFKHFSGIRQRCSEKCPVVGGTVFAPAGDLDLRQRRVFLSSNDGLCANTFHAFHSCQSGSVEFFGMVKPYPIFYPSSLLCGTTRPQQCSLSKPPARLTR